MAIVSAPGHQPRLSNRIAREGAFFAAGYFVYLGLRLTALSDVAPGALTNVERIIAVERQLRLFFEPGLQAWLLEHAHAFVVFSNYFYSLGFSLTLT